MPRQMTIKAPGSLCSFDLTAPEQVREAFAPVNHQWLTADENRRKGARLEV